MHIVSSANPSEQNIYFNNQSDGGSQILNYNSDQNLHERRPFTSENVGKRQHVLQMDSNQERNGIAPPIVNSRSNNVY